MIKVTMTFLLDEDNEPDLKDAMKDWPKDQFFEDQIADDYMPDIVMKTFRPYGYRHTDEVEWKYKLNHKYV